MAQKRVGILGASGYSGFELVRILLGHPGVELVACGAQSERGKTLRQLDPRLPDILLQSTDEVLAQELDVCFAALPHGVSQAVVARSLERGFLTIDLSADFRINDAEEYQRIYATEHSQTQLLPEAVYGLSEWNSEAIAKARLVANPGCYPTTLLLGIAPLARAGLLRAGTVVCDSKSGVSGAGRSAKLGSIFCEVNENFSPYGLGNEHRHYCEMRQEMKKLGADCSLVFSPHLLPLDRGMLSTIYIQLPAQADLDQVRKLYQEAYQHQPLVDLLPSGEIATIRHTQRTQRCVISLHQAADSNTLIVISTIDNVGKGAAGQAVQNMNLACGFEQDWGLR